MHRASTWLLLWAIFSSYVSAFYPYQQHSSPSKDDNEKRFIPFPQRPAEPGTVERLVKADLHKVPVQKRDNKFAVTFSNPPTFGPNALAINQDGSDYSYFSTVRFGSKAQEMYMLIDTGSANTWVFGSDCKSSTCNIHNTFGKEDSTTLETTAEQWTLSYGTGQVSGYVANDTLAFANFTITMGFGLAINASDEFNNYPMDGILGLGRSTSDQLGTATIMDVLSADKRIAANLVGVHLHRAADNTKDGEIVFGGIDTGKFSGVLAYTKTANDGAWEIPVEDMLVNGTPGNFTNRTAIVDTGTTFILMPSSDAEAIHGMIQGSSSSGENFNLPCNTNVKLEVRISGKIYGVSPKDYVGKPIATGSATCNSNIIGHQAFGATQWILGDVFLKNVYTVFDFDGKQIGFGMPGTGGTVASSVNSSSTATSPSGTASASATKGGSASASSGGAKTSSTGTMDSNIGSDGGRSGAAGTNVVGYWKVGLSICVGLWMGLGVILV